MASAQKKTRNAAFNRKKSMMLKIFCLIIWGTLFVFSTGHALATSLGDPAPNLHINKWIKGEVVDTVKERGKKIFVIEFWATWCGPCKMTIPHLTKLQKKYRKQGVEIIGISDETPEKVEKYVRKKGDEMGYTVAIDQNKKTTKAYVEAFGVQGIPYAFIVDREGRIAWHGHPMDGLDRTLEDILRGRFKLDEKILVDRAKKLLPVYFYLVSETREDDLIKSTGQKIYEHAQNNAKFLNALAWQIATREGIRIRDLNYALKVAKRALVLCSSKNDSVVDTYARVLFEMGKTREAIQFQKMAIELCEDKTQREKYKERLKEYQKVQLSGRG